MTFRQPEGNTNTTDVVQVDTHLIEYVLAACVGIPTVFEAARGRLLPEHFNDAERVYGVTWQALLDQHAQLGHVPKHTTLSTAVMSLLQQDPFVPEPVLHDAHGFLNWIFGLASQDATSQETTSRLRPDAAIALDWLDKLIVDRTVRPKLQQIVNDLKNNTVESILPRLVALAEQGSRAARGNDFPVYSDTELDAKEEAGELAVHWLVRNFIALGSPLIVGGKSKTLKTSTLLYIATCISQGKAVFGHEVPGGEPVPVTILSGESGIPILQNCLRRIRRHLGVQSNGKLFLSDQLPDLSDAGRAKAIAGLEQLLRRNGSKFLIIDPAYLCLGDGSDASNIFTMGSRLRPLSDLCQRLNITLCLIHHLKKTSGLELAPPDREDLAFAGFSEFASQWILIGRRKPYADGSGHHRLWLRHGGRAGHEGLNGLDIRERTDEPYLEGDGRCFRINILDQTALAREGEASKEERRQGKVAQQAADLQHSLMQLWEVEPGKAATPAEAKKEIGPGKSVATVTLALQALVAQGRLAARNTLRSGNPTVEYVLPSRQV